MLTEQVILSMNKYLWGWIYTAVLFLVWSLGSVAASRNHYTDFIHTGLGTVYLILGLILILIEVLFWIKGIKTAIDEDNKKENPEDGGK